MGTNVNSKDFDSVTNRLRIFFKSKNFTEVHPQSRLSILAACEDPTTIASFIYDGQVWPLPQTGQMWLEYELLSNPESNGFFCVSTSYRNEKKPVEGRHDKIFPMFEFETKGDYQYLEELEIELLEYLGFENVIIKDYDELCSEYNVDILEHEHEYNINRDHSTACLIKSFPNRTSPFWNMQQNENKTHANKIDVILHGMETIGSAERSCDPEEMKKQFNAISDGEYADLLFSTFTKKRVQSELDNFLEFDFIKRCGGGIGLTRLIRAMKLSSLI